MMSVSNPDDDKGDDSRGQWPMNDVPGTAFISVTISQDTCGGPRNFLDDGWWWGGGHNSQSPCLTTAGMSSRQDLAEQKQQRKQIENIFSLICTKPVQNMIHFYLYFKKSIHGNRGAVLFVDVTFTWDRKWMEKLALSWRTCRGPGWTTHLGARHYRIRDGINPGRYISTTQ